MHGPTSEHEWMINEWIDGQINEQLDGWTDEWMEGRRDEKKDGSMKGLRIEGWMEGRING